MGGQPERENGNAVKPSIRPEFQNFSEDFIGAIHTSLASVQHPSAQSLRLHAKQKMVLKCKNTCLVLHDVSRGKP